MLLLHPVDVFLFLSLLLVIDVAAVWNYLLLFPLATCIAPGTMRANPQVGGFQVISSLVPPCFVFKVCCILSTFNFMCQGSPQIKA